MAGERAKGELDVRLARQDDRAILIDLQRRSSLASADEDVRRHLLDDPDIIDLNPEMISRDEVFVAEFDDVIVGFATIAAHEGNDAELEGIFVDPLHWRKGIGTALLRQVEREALAWGASRLHVVANPNAVDFYIAAGFSRLGERAMPFGPNGILMAKPVR